ncbi:MAG: hypothetical protein ABI459_00100 [Deltaproteobacteria bacterium]
MSELLPVPMEINTTLARLARELGRTAELALQLEMTAAATFAATPVEWQAMDLLVQRLFALRDFVTALKVHDHDALRASSVVNLEEMRAALGGTEFLATAAGDADLF